MTEKKIKRLTADSISSLPNVPEQEFIIEEWGVSLRLKGISKQMQISLGRILDDENKDAFDYQKELLKTCVVDPELDDDLIMELYNKDSKIVDRIFLAINELNGLGGSADAEEFQV